VRPHTEIRDIVREKYGKIAEGDSAGCSCSNGVDANVVLNHLGYTLEQAEAIPDGANLGLGCGNPLAHAAVKRGETVLDLGSGAGIDAFLAAREVGPTGRVIGVDMAASMLRRARENAEKGGYTNVEFRLGEIENLPVADATVDVIISNCVINLSPEKPRVFAEALRVLKPGGRLLVSDLVLSRALPESVRKRVEDHVGCVAGTLPKDDYVRQIREAGFAGVEVVEERNYEADPDVLPDVPKDAMDTWNAVLSVKIRAVKAAKQ